MGEDLASGLKTAAATAAAEADDGPPVERAEQLPLLPAEAIDQLPAEREARRQAIKERRGAGRPAGSVNKRTAEWREYLLRRYRSPLEVLAEAYSRRADDLAAELGCKPVEAFGIQMRAAEALAPYVHGKMPVEVAFTGDRLPVLNMVDPQVFLAAFRAVEGEGPVLDLSSLQPVEDAGTEHEENQGVNHVEKL